jgi:dolichol kinase
MAKPGTVVKSATLRHGEALRPFRGARILLHVGMGLLCLWVSLEFLDAYQEFICTTAVLSTVGLLEAIRFRVPSFNTWVFDFASIFAHKHEKEHITSSTWFWVAMFFIALIQSELVFALTLAVLSLGDQAGGFIGRRYGSIPLLNGRSLQGTLAFITTSAVLSVSMLCIYFPTLSTTETIVLSLTACVSGAISELLCSRIDDNFGVGIGTGLATWAATFLLGLH